MRGIVTCQRTVRTVKVLNEPKSHFLPDVSNVFIKFFFSATDVNS